MGSQPAELSADRYKIGEKTVQVQLRNDQADRSDKYLQNSKVRGQMADVKGNIVFQINHNNLLNGVRLRG